MLEKICALLAQTPELCRQFYMDKEKESFGMLAQMMPQINEAMTSFINAIPRYNEEGAGIPLDIVIAQLNNLVEGLRYKDTLMLADCLQYEISESLSLYKQILEG